MPRPIQSAAFKFTGLPPAREALVAARRRARATVLSAWPNAPRRSLEAPKPDTAKSHGAIAITLSGLQDRTLIKSDLLLPPRLNMARPCRRGTPHCYPVLSASHLTIAGWLAATLMPAPSPGYHQSPCRHFRADKSRRVTSRDILRKADLPIGIPSRGQPSAKSKPFGLKTDHTIGFCLNESA
jgi:hypothetical protein